MGISTYKAIGLNVPPDMLVHHREIKLVTD